MLHGHDSPVQTGVSWDGVVATGTVAGELDISTATPLTERLPAAAAGHPERLVLDPSGLVFAHVAGARTPDEAHTLLQTMCPVIVRQPRPPARKVFEITGLMGISGGSASNDPRRPGRHQPRAPICVGTHGESMAAGNGVSARVNRLWH
jgi:anti-anti-sigma regulatory factor